MNPQETDLVFRVLTEAQPWLIGFFVFFVLYPVLGVIFYHYWGKYKTKKLVNGSGNGNGKITLHSLHDVIQEWGKSIRQDRTDAKEFRGKIWGVVNKLNDDLAEEKTKNAVQTEQLKNLERMVLKQ